MIKTAFTCNALNTRHLFCSAGKFFSFENWNKLNQYFVDEIANEMGIDKKSVFLFGSARMGLYTLLSSLDTKNKNEIIVAGYTCVVVTNAIKYAGLKAVYIDIEEDSLNIDTGLLHKSISSKTRAVIITHNFGISWDHITEFKKQYPDIIFIEDAAHTFGSLDENGVKVGLTGDASFFSLEYSKPLTTGMGGIMIVNNNKLLPDFNNKFQNLPYYPWIYNFRIFISLKLHLLSSSRYNAFLKRWFMGGLYVTGLLYKSPKAELLGEMPKHYPVKLSPHLSYIGYQQLKDIKRINHKKAELVKKYFKTFSDIPGIKQYYSQDYNYVRYPLLFDRNVSSESISQIISELMHSGIYVGEWFNDVVHPKGSFRYGYVEGSCRVGESVSSRIINLPVTIHRQLNDNDLTNARKIFLKHLKI